MNHIDKFGMRDIMKEAIKLAGENTQGVHLSFDVDVLDPMVAPGVGTPVRGRNNLPRGCSCHGDALQTQIFYHPWSL